MLASFSILAKKLPEFDIHSNELYFHSELTSDVPA